MKRVIFGSVMFLAGLLSAAVLLAGTMADGTIVNGYHSAFYNLSQFDLLPALYIFIGIAIIGLAIAIWGMFEKN